MIMADEIPTKTKIDQDSEALKGDIAKILEDVKLPETPSEQLSRAMAASRKDAAMVMQEAASPEVPAIPVSKVPPIVQGDIKKILEDVKLPETREMRVSGDIPVAQVMPHEPPISTALSGTREAQDLRNQIDQSATVPPAPIIEEKKKDKSPVVPLRTLKDDMSAIVESSKMSFIRAASLEEEKKSKVTKVVSVVEEKRSRQRSQHVLGMLFAIIMLFGIGGAALFGVYTITSLQHGTQTQVQDASIVFAEHSVSLVINNQKPEQIKQILSQARTTSTGAVGSIARIVPVITVADGSTAQRPATLSEFLKALGAHAPDDLLRALSDKYFFGIHTVDKNAPILVVPVLSYSRAFAGMLSWEHSMNADLVPVFTAVPTQTRDENGLPIPRTFKDTVMDNYDVRELKDDNGSIVLYYSFPTTQILVIAESPYSFVEILSRLQAGRQL